MCGTHTESVWRLLSLSFPPFRAPRCSRGRSLVKVQTALPLSSPRISRKASKDHPASLRGSYLSLFLVELRKTLVQGVAHPAASSPSCETRNRRLFCLSVRVATRLLWVPSFRLVFVVLLPFHPLLVCSAFPGSPRDSKRVLVQVQVQVQYLLALSSCRRNSNSG